MLVFRLATASIYPLCFVGLRASCTTPAPSPFVRSRTQTLKIIPASINRILDNFFLLQQQLNKGGMCYCCLSTFSRSTASPVVSNSEWKENEEGRRKGCEHIPDCNTSCTSFKAKLVSRGVPLLSEIKTSRCICGMVSE